MPHKLLDAIKNHLSSQDTELDNGDEWGLVQKWLLVASQKDGGGGDPTKSKSHIAFNTNHGRSSGQQGVHPHRSAQDQCIPMEEVRHD
jgi:hypothetical protein